MPFYLLQFDTDEKQNTTEYKKVTDPNNVPLFLVPGIFGHGSCFQHLIKELRVLGETRDIYVYYHPSIFQDEEDTENDMGDEIYQQPSSLEEYVSMIVEEIKTSLPEPRPPFLIAGYSYGCIAALVAEKLHEQGYSAFPFLTDGVSPEISMQHFTEENPSLLQDFIKIIKYAAIETSKSEEIKNNLEKLQIKYDSLPPRSSLTAEKYFIVVKEYILNHIIDINLLNSSLFEKYINNSHQAIKLMSEYQPQSKPKLEQIFALMTDQTAKKYQNSCGGWDTHAKKLTLINEPSLRYLDHLDLLSPRSSKHLAQCIKHFIARVVSADLLYVHHALYLKKDYYKSKGLAVPKEDAVNSLAIGNQDFSTTKIETIKIDCIDDEKQTVISNNEHPATIEATIATLESIMDLTNKDIQFLRKNSPTSNHCEKNKSKIMNKVNFFIRNEHNKENENVVAKINKNF